MITPAKLLRTLQTGDYEVNVPRAIADKARVPIERMIAIG
jgi:quinolinate synthase